MDESKLYGESMEKSIPRADAPWAGDPAADKAASKIQAEFRQAKERYQLAEQLVEGDPRKADEISAKKSKYKGGMAKLCKTINTLLAAKRLKRQNEIHSKVRMA